MAVGPARATLDDLMKTEGKAELIGGRIVALMASGRRPNRVAGRIFRSLDDHAEAVGVGEAYTDNVGFAVARLSSGRESFSPDASYFTGPFPENDMAFLRGAPRFAVEVRSAGDYGPSAEVELVAKRSDYFEAGTLAVWDVDPIAEEVRLYLPENPDTPRVFRRGERADAEKGVPGWAADVDSIFS